MFTGPPVVERAPRLVRLASRWDSQICGKPAEAVRRYRQCRFLCQTGNSRSLVGLARDRALLDSAGRQDFSGRQSAHKTVPVLAVAAVGCAETSPRYHFPVRGVYAPKDYVSPREVGILPILYLLHLAQHQI